MAVRFFLAAVVLLPAAILVARFLPANPVLVGQPPGVLFPPIFVVSSLLLLYGSWAMSRAQMCVVLERQRPFRQSLVRALAAGTGFVAVQSYALTHFFRQQNPARAASGATEFIAVAVGLHGMHFLIAWLFLLFVVLQAHADRYDHEYHWGVTVCMWFWHALGIVWLLVLCVMAICHQTWIDDGIFWEPNGESF